MAGTSLDNLIARSERPLFFALLLAHLFVVWQMPVFLTQDGPSHLYNARILLELWGGDPTGLYSRFFTLNSTFSPNWTGNILLAGLLKLLPPIAAEKALVSLYFIALPLAFRHAVRVLSNATPYLSSLIFLLTYNYHLVYGFFNFCLGLAVLFWFIAAYRRFTASPSWQRGIACAALLLLMLATHPVPLLLSFILMACDGALLILATFSSLPQDRRAVLQRAGRALALAAPALIIFVIFLPASTPDQPPLFENKWSGENWRALLRMDQVIVFGGAEGLLLRLAVLLLSGLLVVAVRKNRSFGLTSTGPALLLLLICCLGIHFFITDQLAGGAYLTSRMALIAWLVFALYIATLKLPVRIAASGALGAAVLSMGLLMSKYPAHARCAEQAAAYIEQCAAIPDGSSFLPLCFSDRGEFGSEMLSPRISVFKHMSGYVAAARPLISLDNYEANTAYFQTAWRPEVNPFTQLCASGDCNVEGQPTTADVAVYYERTQRNIGYVVLWGGADRLPKLSDDSPLMRNLNESYVTGKNITLGSGDSFLFVSSRPRKRPYNDY